MNIPIEQGGKGLKGQDWFLREWQKGQKQVRDRLGSHVCLKGPGEAAEGRAVETVISHEEESQEGILQQCKGACPEHPFRWSGGCER